MLTKPEVDSGEVSLHHRRSLRPKLIVSYCRICGLIIAAGTRPDMLSVVESAHRCPVYQHYAAARVS